jgi:hypothetical protein
MTGRHAKDSIWVGGIDALDAVTPTWIAAAHPELQLTVVDGEVLSNSRSDHWAFLRRGVPTLSFHAGAPGDGRGTGLPVPIRTEQEVRMLRFVFYVGQEVGNGPPLLRLTQEGRRRFLKSLSP